jgi:short-subunit dehydrogenase
MNNSAIPYTLITGASEGLGKSIALECASRGLNLILVALPGIELYHLASHIRNKYGVKVCEIEMDLALPENYHKLFEMVTRNNISVNMLINNAGIGGTNFFDECSLERWQKQIQVNISATVALTYLFLPLLKQYERSYILNVSSLCVFFFLPKKQVYGATKSFIRFFSKALRKELLNSGTTVSVVYPGPVNTNPLLYLINRAGSWLGRTAAMNPNRVAKITIDQLFRRKEKIIPGKLNRLFLFTDKLLPAFIKNKITGRQMNRIDQTYFEMLLKGKINSVLMEKKR